MNSQSHNILIVIPARGGSKGIPRKNLRILAGQPLLSYAIQTCLSSSFKPDVYVSSEDEEIRSVAEQFGAKTIVRNADFSKDLTTLDPVIFDAYTKASTLEKKTYDLIITIQPTSPLLQVVSLDTAIQLMIDEPNIDTLISAKNSTHLSWKKEENKFVPNYEERLNRQELPQEYTETGGFLITRKSVITKNTRIGKNVSLYELTGAESIDIDNFEDWNLCEYYIKRKTILFVVTGNYTAGLGHVYNTLQLADGIVNHNISFLVDRDSQLAYDKIKQSNHTVYIQQKDNILDDINSISPDIVINDKLDTSSKYISALKNKGYCVINFEDLGKGAILADLVVNAMYPEEKKINNHHYGQDFFCLRSDFQYASKNEDVNKKVKSIILTFGGVDPNNYTYRILKEIHPYCIEKGIEVDIVLGMGYQAIDSLEPFSNINLHRNISNLSQLVKNADIAFTSAGRTTFEVASIGTPAIILAQNEREKTHFFAGEEFGFQNLGLGYQLKDGQIQGTFQNLVNDFQQRQEMFRKMTSYNLRKGKQNVISLINQTIEAH